MNCKCKVKVVRFSQNYDIVASDWLMVNPQGAMSVKNMFHTDSNPRLCEMKKWES